MTDEQDNPSQNALFDRDGPELEIYQMSRHRVVARPAGAGKILLGDRLLAQCRYALTVRQESIPAGRRMVTGFSEIDGVLTGRKTWEDIESKSEMMSPSRFTWQTDNG